MITHEDSYFWSEVAIWLVLAALILVGAIYGGW